MYSNQILAPYNPRVVYKNCECKCVNDDVRVVITIASHSSNSESLVLP